MVLKLEGNSGIGKHVWRNLFYLICLGHFIRSKSDVNRIIFSPKLPIFLPSCAACAELPSDISTLALMQCVPQLYGFLILSARGMRILNPDPDPTAKKTRIRPNKIIPFYEIG